MPNRHVSWTRHAGRCAVLAVLLAGASACGGPIAFVDTQPIAVAGDAPPPPPPPPKRVEVLQDRIQINDTILFDFDKATIRPESHGLLNEIAQVIKANAHIKKLSIEGHTDSDGKDAYNLKLSDGRAAAVLQYLTGAGIAGSMLSSKGHGESRPIASNDDDEGKQKNRRVEFLITEQDEVKKVYLEDPATGQRTEVTAEGGAQ